MASFKLNVERFAKDIMSSPPGPSEHPQAGYEIIGPLFIAFILSTMLFGVSCAQGCLYFKQRWQDSTQLKYIVFAILCLETTNITLVTHGIFMYIIIDHGDFTCLNGRMWSLLFQVIPANLIVTLVHYVWIIRIRTLSRSPRRANIALAMQASVFIEAGLSITWLILASMSASWGKLTSAKWTCVTAFLFRLFNDISLTALLCYHLQRSKNGLRKTDSMIQTMMGYGLRSGVINCFGSLTLIMLITILPTKPYYTGVHAITARLYANSLLAMLNRRHEKSSEATDLKGSEIVGVGAVELSTVNWDVTMRSQITTAEFN
ncbi:hypothetical protein PILCRDRAFT_810386 [Piloderma croceum F 1598]|uniref:DUF6534 domain-containing protein n=1 Tax=Piloderma croceum (strain F 1598) TaxID=765440 RepID=A0A0C3G7X2_PILCF|nr:hypothetical protein PILCRDRAFT_810386 [Piloderma croceum F 1598]